MLKQELSHIKNIVFDIGNVLVDIDYQVTIGEFQKLAEVDFSQIVSYTKQEQIFDRFERGEISVEAFLKDIKKYLKPEVDDDAIIRAWNSILIHYPTEKFELLEQLKRQYKIYALSNINAIHATSLDVAAQKLFGKESFRDFFHHAFYSHEMGARKPEQKIYEQLLRQATLNPAETLFIDDKEENTSAAAEFGIHIIHLNEREKLLEKLL